MLWLSLWLGKTCSRISTLERTIVTLWLLGANSWLFSWKYQKGSVIITRCELLAVDVLQGIHDEKQKGMVLLESSSLSIEYPLVLAHWWLQIVIGCIVLGSWRGWRGTKKFCKWLWFRKCIHFLRTTRASCKQTYAAEACKPVWRYHHSGKIVADKLFILGKNNYFASFVQNTILLDS